MKQTGPSRMKRTPTISADATSGLTIVEQLRRRKTCVGVSICLAAAAMAALRCRCILGQVLSRVMIELLFAFGAAEVIRLSSVLGVPSGSGSFNFHSANRIFHGGGAAHRESP